MLDTVFDPEDRKMNKIDRQVIWSYNTIFQGKHSKQVNKERQ